MTDIPVDQLPAYLAELERTFHAPLKEGLDKCAAEIRGAYEQNFDSASSPTYGGWPPRKDTLPHPLLVLSGKLKAAATQQGAAGHVEENDGRELGVGVEKSSDLPYTHVHQYGWKAIPPRPYIDVSEQTVDKCEQHVADDLAAKLGHG